MTKAPEVLGAVAESPSKSSILRWLTSSGSQVDSERNHCRLCASLRCAPTRGSVLAKAVKVLLRSAGKSNPSR